MCELLGMNASFATELKTSLSLLQPRGGEIRPHADGWGLAIFADGDPVIVKEPEPASSSALFRLIRSLDLNSPIILAHIRKANPTNVGRRYENTHPFRRSAAGRSWVFAHNGKLPGIQREPLTRFQPAGATDSEHAFCMILEAIDKNTPFGGDILAEDLADILAAVTERINTYGEFNYILSDGIHMMAHAHTYLHVLGRSCHPSGNRQSVVLVASHPLTDDEPWTCLVPNTLTFFRDGTFVHQRDTTGLAPNDAWEAQARLANLALTPSQITRSAE